MSVYIKIKEAHLQVNAIKAGLHISSSDNTLKAEQTLNGSSLAWNTSMISSSKEKKLVFEIKNDSESISYGKGEIYFSSLRPNPEKQFSENISLDNGGHISIDVFYTQRQNFIGEIAFYNYQILPSKPAQKESVTVETTKAESIRFFENTPKVNAAPVLKSTGGLFFCCGDEGDDKQFTVEQDLSQPIFKANTPFDKQLASPVLQKNPTQAVQFYKGPCKTTNMFSFCDAGMQNQKFTVIQDYYRDK